MNIKAFLSIPVFVVCFTRVAPAATVNIPITNPSFEADVLTCAAGASCALTDVLSGWTGSTPAPPSYTAAYWGVFKPSAVQYPNGVPNGVNIAYLTSVVYTVSVSQTLSTALQANTTYNLTFYIGERADPQVYGPGLGCNGYDVALMAGGTLLNSLGQSGNASCGSLKQGTFTPFTLTYTSGANPAGLGSPLQIVLTSNGSGSPYEPAEIDFDYFTLTATGTGSSTSCTIGAPQITSVNSATDFGHFSNFASGSYLEVKGTNLAVDTRQWATSDFAGSSAPTNLDGSMVSINGIPGYVSYISGQQVNVQAPADPTTGLVPITVTNCAGASNTVTFQKNAVAPGMLAPAAFNVGKQYLAALFASDLSQGILTYVGNSGLIAGANFRPARPNDTIILYGVGFGAVTPATAPGIIASGTTNLAGLSISFGSTPAMVSYAGLYPGFVGLYEFFVTVPNVVSGDSQINISINGTPVPQTLFLTVQD